MIGHVIFSGRLINEPKAHPTKSGKGSKVFMQLRCQNGNGEYERVIASAYIPEQVPFNKTPYAYPKKGDSVTIECSIKFVEVPTSKINPDTGEAYTNPVAYFNIEQITLNNTKAESQARVEARQKREDEIVAEIEEALAEMDAEGGLPDSIPDPIPN